MFSSPPQMLLKNITDNAKNLATSAKIEDMSRIFKSHISAKQDVKNVLSGVMVGYNLYAPVRIDRGTAK